MPYSVEAERGTHEHNTFSQSPYTQIRERAHWKQLIGTEDWSTKCSLAHPQMGTILDLSSSSGIEISSSDPKCVV